MGNILNVAPEYWKLLDEIDENEGVIEEVEEGELTIYDRLIALEGSVDDKLDNICKYINHLNGDITTISDEIERLSDRKNSYAKKVERLKKYLLMILKAFNFRGKNNWSRKTTNFTIFSKESESIQEDKEELAFFDPICGIYESPYVSFTCPSLKYTASEIVALKQNGKDTIVYNTVLDKKSIKPALLAQEIKDAEIAARMNNSESDVPQDLSLFDEAINTTKDDNSNEFEEGNSTIDPENPFDYEGKIKFAYIERKESITIR